MAYVHGFLLPVKKDRIEDYKQISIAFSRYAMEGGATSYAETVGEPMEWGTATSFPRAVQLEDDEVVVFSWVVYPDKAAADAVNAKVMSAPEFQGMDNLPFDGKRMMGGGFEPLLMMGSELKA